MKLEDLLPQEMLDKEIYYDEGIGGKVVFPFSGKCNADISRAMQWGLEVIQKSWKWREIQCRFTCTGGECAGRAGVQEGT